MEVSGKEPLKKALILAAGAVALILTWSLVGCFRTWSNDNAGFVSAVGLFLVIPLAILSARLLERRRRSEQARAALDLLVHELWHNLNHVSQIEQSYNNNFEWFEKEEPIGIHIPHFGPRLSILEKFISIEHLSALTERRRNALIEIYAQLSTLKEEFPRWRASLENPAVLNDRDVYIAISSTILSIIDPVMRNMIWLWADILPVAGRRTPIGQIGLAANLISSKIASGHKIHTAYKSSQYSNSIATIAKPSVILCWVHDWREAPLEVIELRTMVPLHESWLPRSGGNESEKD